MFRRWWRYLLIRLGIRRITPRWNERLPNVSNLRHVPDIGDTGGGGWYRPKWKMQDPSKDPKEPWGDESSSRGNDHGWCNCTMCSGAIALDFHTLGELGDKYGGNMRHRQGDLEGGTDLYDLRDAWEYYDQTLTIRSGAGWEALKEDRADGRALVVQGQGNVPGSESFDGGHACVISPETHSSGDWLFGDPLADGWQWVSPSSVKSWMQAWNSSMSYARTAAHKPAAPPEPEPEPPKPPDPPKPKPWPVGTLLSDAEQRGAVKALDAVFASWFDAALPEYPLGVLWSEGTWDSGDQWCLRWPVPMGARSAATFPHVWDGSAWTATVWE